MLAGDHFRTASRQLENGFVGPPPKHHRRRAAFPVPPLRALGQISSARRLSPAGFPVGFGRAELLILLFILALLGRGFWRLPGKSGCPPLFELSLKVQRDLAHYPTSGFAVLPWHYGLNALGAQKVPNGATRD